MPPTLESPLCPQGKTAVYSKTNNAMASHASNAGEEVERLRKNIQAQDAWYKEFQKVVGTWPTNDNNATNAQHAEALATIATLKQELSASEVSHATTERLLRLKQAELDQANKECKSLELCQRSAIDAMETVVDEAKQSLKCNKGESIFILLRETVLQKAMEKIDAVADEYLVDAQWAREAEIGQRQSREELLLSLTSVPKGTLENDEQQNVQAPGSAATSCKPAALSPEDMRRTAPLQPQAPMFAAKAVASTSTRSAKRKSPDAIVRDNPKRIAKDIR